jgi:hypothetical protein
MSHEHSLAGDLSLGTEKWCSRVWGFTNYPNPQDAFFYLARISELSLAGCSNLTHVALVGSSHTLSTNMENLWFSDLQAAQAGGKPNGISAVCDGGTNTFFYPLNPGITNYAAVSYLSSIGWQFFGGDY